MGLYDDDNTAVESGDLKERDYWRAKFNAEMLEQALQTRQPEGLIGLELIGALSLLDDLRKTYPNHRDLKAWRERALAVQAKIDSNASRNDSFTSRCQWGHHAYREAYVGYHCGKIAASQGDYALATDCLKTARQKLTFIQGRIADGGTEANWPDEAKSWAVETDAEVARLLEA